MLMNFASTVLTPLAGALATVAGSTSGTLKDESFWMPARASTAATATDFVFYFVLWITVFFTVLVTGVMIYFAVKYRHREGKPAPGKTAGHSTALEVTWTVIPTIIVIIIFFYGFRGYLDQAVVPPDAINVKVTARMWAWSFTYPAANGGTSDVLYVPIGKPVMFTLQSEDTIHSLYIPAFRMKKDVVPGRYNKMWATATQLGEFPIECAEYCGTNHSRMRTLYEPKNDPQTGKTKLVMTGTRVVVLSEDDWRKKMKELSNPFLGRTVAEVGELLYNQRGCAGCHSLDGSVIIGPSWKNVWGHEAAFTDGTKQIADENYIRESILYPQKKIVAGFGGQMPSYAGALSDKEIDAIIEYMKTLADGYKPVAGTGTANESKQDAAAGGSKTGSTSVGGPRSEGNAQ